VIEALKEKIAGLTSLPELARTLAEDSRLSGKPASVYANLAERLEKGKRAAAEAAAELGRTAAQAQASGTALAAAEGELSGLRAELALKKQELSGFDAALTEAAAREKISAEEKAALEAAIAGAADSAVLAFGSPFVLNGLRPTAGLCAFCSLEEFQRAAARALFGKPASGSMPVSIEVPS